MFCDSDFLKLQHLSSRLLVFVCLGALLGFLGAPLDPLEPLSVSLGGHLGLPRRRLGALLLTFLQKYAFLKTCENNTRKSEVL